MSGSPTLNTKKKTQKIERGEFITPPRPMGRRSKKRFGSSAFDRPPEDSLILDETKQSL